MCNLVICITNQNVVFALSAKEGDVTTIPPQELAELRRTVFDDRQSTATDAAEPYGVAMLIDTTRATPGRHPINPSGAPG